MHLSEWLKNVTKQEKWDTGRNSNVAALPTLDRSNAVHGSFEVIEAQHRFPEKSFARRRWSHTSVIPLEKGRSNSIF